MERIKHYIDSIKKGDVFFDSSFKLALIVREAGIFHLILSAAFFVFGDRDLGLYNAVSMAFYFCCPLLIKKKRHSLLLNFTISEVILQGIVTTAVIGFDTGFVFYYFAALCGISYFITTWEVFEKKEKAVIAYSAVTAIFGIVCFVLSVILEPIQPLGHAGSMFFPIFNIVMTFATTSEFMIFLQWDVIHKSETLSSKNSELDVMANVDPLTGLYNRRFMNQKLEEKYTELGNNGTIFGIIMGDIDNFKRVNDTYGHDVGDEVLKMVAKSMKKSTRDDDYVCRWGGEEFLIVINGNKRITLDVAERMRKMISETPVANGKSEIAVTMTFGVTESIPGYSIDKLIEIADDNLYKGKTNGKNQVVI